jgi:hypothetical protein
MELDSTINPEFCITPLQRECEAVHDFKNCRRKNCIRTLSSTGPASV